MTFQVTYTGDVLTRNIFYETPKNKGDEFTKKMNAIAKEIKKMQKAGENNLDIEERVFNENDGMASLVQKEFTIQVLDDCCDGGDEYYVTHDSEGRLEVDGEKIELDKDFYDGNEEWEKALKERLDKLDWHVVYSMTYSGFHNNGDWDGIEGEFDKKKIKLKDTCIYYDDSPIASPDGCDWTRELVLYVNATGDEFSMDIELEYADDL